MNRIEVLKNAINRFEAMPLNEEEMEQYEAAKSELERLKFFEEPESEEGVRYPWVSVLLSQGVNGNPLAICAEVTRAMKKAGIPKEERDSFLKEALSSDYDHVLQTCMKWVNVE